MGKKGLKRWKTVEARHAKQFGGEWCERTGPMGREYPDWNTGTIAGESKSTQVLAIWLVEAVEQAIRNEQRWREDKGVEFQVPLAVFHETGMPFDNDLVVIRADVFRRFILPLMKNGLPSEENVALHGSKLSPGEAFTLPETGDEPTSKSDW